MGLFGSSDPFKKFNKNMHRIHAYLNEMEHDAEKGKFKVIQGKCEAVKRIMGVREVSGDRLIPLWGKQRILIHNLPSSTERTSLIALHNNLKDWIQTLAARVAGIAENAKTAAKQKKGTVPTKGFEEAMKTLNRDSEKVRAHAEKIEKIYHSAKSKAGKVVKLKRPQQQRV